MYKSINLTLKNISNFRKINSLNSNFNLSNKDFFQQYDKSNAVEKFLLRKNVKLLVKEYEYIGYIWFEKLNKFHSSINSLNITSDNDMIDCYKLLINNVVNDNLITYECEDDDINSNALSQLGFKKNKGVIELEKTYDECYHILAPDNITFNIVKKGRDEKTRCTLQNEIFKNHDRIPISLEDIYYDEAQDYYLEEGAIFIELDNLPIGYGQIIIEDNAAVIVNFGIVEKYRSQGYGKVFLIHLLNIIKNNNFSKVMLKVDANNTTAFNLYKSLGFTVKKKSYTWQKYKINFELNR